LKLLITKFQFPPGFYKKDSHVRLCSTSCRERIWGRKPDRLYVILGQSLPTVTERTQIFCKRFDTKIFEIICTVGQKYVSLFLSLSFYIKFAQASVFQANHIWSSKVFFTSFNAPSSKIFRIGADQDCGGIFRYESCCPNSTTVSEGLFQAETYQKTLYQSACWTNSGSLEVCMVTLKVAVASHGQSRQKITSWQWDNVGSSIQGNTQDVCTRRQIFQEVQLCA